MLDTMKRKKFLSASLLALAFAGCDLSDAPAEEGRQKIQPPVLDTAEGVVTTRRLRYWAMSDSMRIKPDPPIVRVHCSDDGFTPYRTNDTMSMSLAWRISGDTLRYGIQKDTVTGFEGAEGTFAIERWQALVRVSGSDGLTGSWRSVGWGGRVLSGEAPDGFFELDSLDRLLQTLFVSIFTFDGEFLTMTTLKRSAQYYLADWEGKFEGIPSSDSSAYDMEALALGGRHLRMTGRRSGEIVDIRWSDSLMTYTSSDESHALHVWRVEPKSCSGSYTPSWWGEFLLANWRSEDSAAGGMPRIGTVPRALAGAPLMSKADSPSGR